MMQFIRNHTKGTFAKILLGLIIIAFVGTGASMFTGGTVSTDADSVAKVNDIPISRFDFDQAYANASRPFLGQDLPEEFIAMQKEQVLDQLINAELLRQQSVNMNLVVGDLALSKAVMEQSVFQKNGKFDEQTYIDYLSQVMRTNPAAFEESVRAELAMQDIQQGIYASGVTGTKSLDMIAAIDGQTRDLKIAAFPLAQYLDKVAVTDEEVESYYEENQAQFMQPERIKVKYVEISDAKVKEKITVSDEDLLAAYERRKEERYTTPEKRSIDHIFVSLESGQQNKEIEDKFVQLAKMAEKESVAVINLKAQELLGDQAIIESLDKLAFNASGDQVFDEKVFNQDLKVNEWVGPFYSPTGLHLVNVKEIEEAQVQSLESVKDELKEDVLASMTNAQYMDIEEQFQVVLEEHPDQLDDLATAVNEEVQTSDWLDINSRVGLLENDDVFQAVHSDEFLTMSQNSPAISLGANHAIALRLEAHEEERVLSLEEARNNITSLLAAKAALALAEADAEKLKASLEENPTDFTELASTFNAETMEFSEVKKENANINSLSPLMQSSYRKAFEGGEQVSEEAPMLSIHQETSGVGLIMVSNVSLGTFDDYSEEEKSALEAQVSINQNNVEYQAFIEALKEQAKIRKTLDTNTGS